MGAARLRKPNGNNVLITNYAISPTLVDCSASAPAGAANLTIAWKSLNGNTAFFGVNTTDAQAAGMGWNLPASGSNLDFPSGAGNPYTYQCGDAQESFTITVVGNGSKQSLTITVRTKVSRSASATGRRVESGHNLTLRHLTIDSVPHISNRSSHVVCHP